VVGCRLMLLLVAFVSCAAALPRFHADMGRNTLVKTRES